MFGFAGWVGAEGLRCSTEITVSEELGDVQRGVLVSSRLIRRDTCKNPRGHMTYIYIYTHTDTHVHRDRERESERERERER